jgi:NAD(P)-dependent dehydrogenase (short-subunit alcohol dehydrogenase family)
VLVTGSTAGIGPSANQEFAREGDLIVNDRSEGA